MLNDAKRSRRGQDWTQLQLWSRGQKLTLIIKLLLITHYAWYGLRCFCVHTARHFVLRMCRQLTKITSLVTSDKSQSALCTTVHKVERIPPPHHIQIGAMSLPVSSRWVQVCAVDSYCIDGCNNTVAHMLVSWPTFTLLSLPLCLECYNRP